MCEWVSTWKIDESHYKKKNFFIATEKNNYNNVRVIAIIDKEYCNKIWGNRFVQQIFFFAINSKI